MKICPVCKYKRTKADDSICSQYECPKCGVLYNETSKTSFFQNHQKSKKSQVLDNTSKTTKKTVCIQCRWFRYYWPGVGTFPPTGVGFRSLRCSHPEKTEKAKMQHYDNYCPQFEKDFKKVEQGFKKGFFSSFWDYIKPKTNKYDGFTNNYLNIDDEDAKKIVDLMYQSATKMGKGDYIGALKDYELAEKINSDFVEHIRVKAITKHHKLGDDKSKIKDFDNAIKDDPFNPKAYYNRGILMGELGEDESALNDFDRAIKIDPEFAEAYHNRGIAKHNLGDKEGACQDWKKAWELGYLNSYDLIKKRC